MFKSSLTASPEKYFCKWSTITPELDPVLNEAIDIWDAQLSQLQQPQTHQIQQPEKQYPQIQQNHEPNSLYKNNTRYQSLKV